MCILKINSIIGRLSITFSCFLLLLNVLALPIYASTSGECGEDVNWNLSNGILTITGNGAMNNYYDGNFAPWFETRDKIINIVIEEGITNIGNTAFYDCNNLKNVKLPDSVTTIGEYAFLQCEKLETVKMSSSLETIGRAAFKMCESLVSIDLPEGLQSIGYEAYFNCDSLISVRVPSTVYLMEDSVFAYCSNLVQAYINASIRKLPVWTFYGCSSLVSVEFSETIRDIGELSFYRCDNLQYVNSDASLAVTETLTDQIKEDVPTFDAVEKNGSVSSETVYRPESGNVIQKDAVENDDIVLGGNIEQTDDGEIDVTLDTVVKNESGWNTVIEKTEEYIGKNESFEQDDPVDVNVFVQDDQKISGDLLNELAGENVNIRLNIDNMVFGISGNSLDKEKNYKDFILEYSLERIDNPDENIKAVLGEAQGYYLTFNTNADFDITVKVNLHSDGYATLYQDNKGWKLVQSVKIDSEGYASFYLGSFDKYTKYLIGVNVDSIEQNSIILSEEEYDNYGGLMDEFGNKYEITGVESRWGITLGQFTMYVVFAMIVIVALVGVVMYVLFKKDQMQNNMKRMVQKQGK